MRLTVGLSDALRITRALRAQRIDLHSLPRGELQAPDPSPAKRWSAQAIDCDALLLSEPPSPGEPVDVIVSRFCKAPRTKLLHASTLRDWLLPQNSFIQVDDEIWIPRPEMLFAQMGSLLSPVEHLALALELCGSYTLDAHEPNRGASTFDIAPATSEEEIRAFLASYPQAHIWGMQQARSLAPLITDNSWSPMETSVATVLSIPVTSQGYGLGPLVLNKRFAGGSTFVGARTSRVPDILFAGTHVGFNYDSSDHLPIDTIAHAGLNLGLNPGSRARERELDKATRDARHKFVDDRRRDRELMAAGLQVISVTSEDLYEPGGMDALARWAIDRIEAEGARNLLAQRDALTHQDLARTRQLLLWSLLPGRRGDMARSELERR